MASLQGFMDGSYDYKQFYNIKDLAGPLPKPAIHCNTLLGALEKNKDCIQFVSLLKSLPMSAIYNNNQASFTLFVPIANYCNVNINDSYKVRQFILLHTLEHAVSYPFLKSSKGMLLNTRLPGSNILVENIYTDTPLLNRQSKILGQQIVGNSVIYFIDVPLCLDQNPLSNVDI